MEGIIDNASLLLVKKIVHHKQNKFRITLLGPLWIFGIDLI